LALADLYNSSDSEKTMYGTIQEGETKKRSLHQDDINGIRYLYPTETAAPTLTITSHSDGEHVSTSSIALEGTASDSGKGDNGIYQVTVNGQPANNDTADGDNTADWNISLTLSEGANSITVIAQDNSCNHNEKTQTITLYYDPGDTVEPDTFMTDGPSGTIKYRNVTFTFTGSDDVTETSRLSYSYKLEGYQNSWTSYASSTSANYTRLASGTYTFFVRAKDEAGNVDSSPASRTFTVDYVLLPPTGVSASDGTYNDRVDVSWNAVNDAYAYQVWRNVISNENTATQLSSNVFATHYNDYSATPGQIYYYWVKSRTYGLIISDFSEYDTGWLTSTEPVTSIEISGPSAVDENTGYQYSCLAHYQAGNTADVTEDTTWSEDCRFASINDIGYLTTGLIRSDQTCSISAVYSGQTSSHSIVIKNVTDDDINSIVPLIILLLGQDSVD
ncbi:MAG: hypothetical protein KJP23_00930, partial [Deltaproteobacteria bacterium]|nr:hypothetical protein [Deltaproteobacteria bacterium]